ncbi:MAG: hypothetical protein U5K79_15500 [Cyclobacteriaceae bacterium]|nr:hypothetical protein [Cyclobacteriaceae bacterium]
MNLKARVKEQLEILEIQLTPGEIANGRKWRDEGRCILLSQAGSRFDFTIEHDTPNAKFCALGIVNDDWVFSQLGLNTPWDDAGYACLLVIKDELNALNPKGSDEHKRYTCEGMKNRVLEERRLRAKRLIIG